MISWTVRAENLDALSKEAQRIGQVWDVLKQAVADVVDNHGEEILAPFRIEPGNVVYADNGHLRWKSPAQRKKVMALLREADNLPYKRTRALVGAWNLEPTINDSAHTILVEAVNPSEIEQFVTGDYQQPFHTDTGWPKSAETAIKQSGYASGLVIDRFGELMSHD